MRSRTMEHKESRRLRRATGDLFACSWRPAASTHTRASGGITRSKTNRIRTFTLIFPSHELATHLGGELVGPDVSIDGAGIDSRTIQPGQLYAPIVAERDGHAFIPAALEAGATAYLTAQEPVGGTAIRVPDTAAALLSLGALARGRVGGTIGITGSGCKTTPQDPLAPRLAPTVPTPPSGRSLHQQLR